MRVALAQINPTVFDFKENLNKILDSVLQSKKKGVQLLIFPELALTGYPAKDLLFSPSLKTAVSHCLEEIRKASQDIAIFIGAPREAKENNVLFNSCFVFFNEELVFVYDKQLLPTYDVFNEKRYFSKGATSGLFTLFNKKIFLTICEDIWAFEENHLVNPLDSVLRGEVDLIINLSASPFVKNKNTLRREKGKALAKEKNAFFLLCNQVGGNDSLIFDGNSFVIDKNQQLIGSALSFEEDLLFVDLENPCDPIFCPTESMEHISLALTLGIKDYFQKSGFKKAFIGLSGGIDSAVVLCLAVQALGKENVKALLMPSRFSSKQGIEDALLLAKNLEVSFEILSIEKPFKAFLESIEPHFPKAPFGIMEENLQARIRGNYLMAFANKENGLVLSTGNKSEIAVGFSTLYGDTCGAISPIADLKKGEVYALASFLNRFQELIPRSILEKAPSAELKENQTDQDTLPPYPFLDCLIEEYIENNLSPSEIVKKHSFNKEEVEKWCFLIQKNEFKRRQSPFGFKVSKKAFFDGREMPLTHKGFL